MIAQCSYIPEAIWIREITNGIRHITLRRNFTEEIETREGIDEKTYTFEETDVYIPDRENIEQFTNENFGNLFDLGLQQNDERAINDIKLQETERLIKTGQLVDDIQLIGQQLTDIMLEVL